jgi:hypothetical protein
LTPGIPNFKFISKTDVIPAWDDETAKQDFNTLGLNHEYLEVMIIENTDQFDFPGIINQPELFDATDPEIYICHQICYSDCNTKHILL